MSAWPAMAATVGVLLAVYAPGAAVLAVAGLRGLALVALAPAVSTAVVTLTAVAAGVVGLSWSWVAAAAGAAVAAAVALAARRSGVTALRLPRADRTGAALAWGGAAAALLLAALPIAAGLAGIGAVPRAPDAGRQLALLDDIVRTGSASPLTVTDLPGADGTSRPSGWHDLVALAMSVSGADAAVAANVTTLVLAGLVIPIGAGYAAAALLPRWSWAAPLGMLGSTAFVALPTLPVAFGPLWPVAWAAGLLPGVLGGLVLLLRAPGRALVADAVWLLAAAGVAAAWFRAAGWLVLLSVPLLLAAAGRRWARLWRSGDRRRPLLEAGAAAVLSAVALVVDVLVTAGRPIPGPRTMTEAQAAGEALFDTPLSEFASGVAAPAWQLATVLVVGVVVALRSPDLRAWALSWLVAVALYTVAAGTRRDHVLRRLVTSWWSDEPVRIAALLPVVAAPLLVIAVHALLSVVARRSGRLRGRRELLVGLAGVLLVALLSFARADVRTERIQLDYDPAGVSAAGERSVR